MLISNIFNFIFNYRKQSKVSTISREIESVNGCPEDEGRIFGIFAIKFLHPFSEDIWRHHKEFFAILIIYKHFRIMVTHHEVIKIMSH